eukprot:Awhi_evm1s14334
MTFYLAWGSNALRDHIGTETDVVLVDLFNYATRKIKRLRSQGKIVICYLSVGTVERWRPDYLTHKSEWRKLELDRKTPWYQERWIDIKQLKLLKKLMKPRILLAKEKGCSGIEPDNIDNFANQP